MLFLHYFAVVGATLVGLLFVADACLPQLIAREKPERRYQILVYSDRKGPEAVTFSGHTFVPAEVVELSPITSKPQNHLPVAVAPSVMKSESKPQQRADTQKVRPRSRPIYQAIGPWHISRERLAYTRQERAFNPGMF